MPPSPDDVRRIIAEAVRPAHFFVGPSTRLEWEHRDAEEVSWEVFRGRLLDPAHTRRRQTFEAWNVYFITEAGRSPEPLLAVKLDAPAGQVHVVRAIFSYAWEGYDAGGNVILSRETKKWVRELVGTIDLADFSDADELRDEIVCRLFQAVVGTSRLPLTSVEAPLPAFTFGELAYFYRAEAGMEPIRSRRALVECGLYEGLTWREKAKWLETVLRSERPRDVHLALNLYAARVGDSPDWPCELFSLLRTVFNDVSLSPFTDLTENALRLADLLAYHLMRRDEHADFLAHLLCQIGRHLTAYDLVMFHHSGANYPDALLLDAVLASYLRLTELFPTLLLDAAEEDEPSRKAKRLRRCGLRQAWLIRQRYRGHLVPDAPTSPGENSRVLPAPHVRIPEEQFLQPHRRTKRLFTEDAAGGPLGANAAAVLRQSIADLDHPDELRELGAALYLDRPLGMFKAPGEPDQTPLLSYVAFSRTIAAQRLLLLGRDEEFLATLQSLPVVGLPVAETSGVSRPGAVSLADARKAADDFVFLRTTAQTTRAFFELFDFRPLSERFSLRWDSPLLIVGKPSAGEIVLTVYEAGQIRPRLEVSASPGDRYICRAGVEYPRKGLRVRRVWAEGGEHDLGAEELFVRPV